MSCAAGKDCKVPQQPSPGASGNHGCRGGCGGRLHGTCGTADPTSDNEMHRLCPKCFASRGKPDGAAEPAGSKRRASTSEGLGAGSSKRSKPATAGKGGPRTKPRTRLNNDQKMAVLKMIDEKVIHKEIASRFPGLAERTIRQIKLDRVDIEAKAKASKGGTKTNRPGEFPEVRHFFS